MLIGDSADERGLSSIAGSLKVTYASVRHFAECDVKASA